MHGLAANLIKGARFIIVFALLGMLLYPARAAEWYESEGASCSGYQPLGDAISAITGGGLQINSAGGPGNFFASITATELNSFASPNQEKILNTKQLDSSTAQSLRNLFATAAENVKVPSFVTYGSALATGLLLPPKLGTATGLGISYLLSLKDAFAADIHDVGLFIAAGGEVYKRETLLRRQTDQNEFVSSSTEYQVMVGNEKRAFVIQNCIYPLKITVSEFDTTGQFNNKIIKPVGGNNWKQWDIDDKKFDSWVYTYIYQTGGYYYFESDEVQNNVVVGKNLYRIGLFGGPFSTMDYDTRPNGRWKNFYLKVIAQ